MEHDHCVPQCRGAKLIVLGLILAANEYYFKFNWWYLFAALLVVKGIVVLAFKGCMCHKYGEYTSMSEDKPKKKAK